MRLREEHKSKLLNWIIWETYQTFFFLLQFHWAKKNKKLFQLNLSKTSLMKDEIIKKKLIKKNACTCMYIQLHTILYVFSQHHKRMKRRANEFMCEIVFSFSFYYYSHVGFGCVGWFAQLYFIHAHLYKIEILSNVSLILCQINRSFCLIAMILTCL